MLAASETYELKMVTLDNGQPEECFRMMRNFNIDINEAGNSTVSGRITYVCTMLRSDSLREFDKLAIYNNGTTNSHLKHIQEVLLR